MVRCGTAKCTAVLVAGSLLPGGCRRRTSPARCYCCAGPKPLPGAPLAVRTLLAAGRSLFAGVFARSYRARSPDPLLNVDAWIVVHMAARLAEGIAAERARLIGALEAARRLAATGHR
jgi:hypothetical protein